VKYSNHYLPDQLKNHVNDEGNGLYLRKKGKE